MIVVLFGVSGVGRTSVIRQLCEKFNWKKIPVYTTRAVRKNEKEYKYPVTLEEFENMNSNNEFFCRTNVYGNYYGFSHKSILEAISSNDGKWIVDFALSNAPLLQNIPFVGILLLPENRETLIGNLINGGRGHRVEEVLSRYEYDLHEVNSGNKYIDVIVHNEAGKLDFVVNQINNINLHEYYFVKTNAGGNKNGN